MSAETVARAVVAAARVLGDDPIAALTARKGPARRVLTAAGSGLVAVTGQPLEVVSRVLGINLTSISRAKRRGDKLFWQAADAAQAAARAQLLSPPAWTGETDAAAPKVWGGAVRVLAASAVRREVRELLHIDNATAPEIAATLRLSEAVVRSALRELAEMGEVRADAMTAEGWRVQTWRWGRPA